MRLLNPIRLFEDEMYRADVEGFHKGREVHWYAIADPEKFGSMLDLFHEMKVLLHQKEYTRKKKIKNPEPGGPKHEEITKTTNPKEARLTLEDTIAVKAFMRRRTRSLERKVLNYTKETGIVELIKIPVVNHDVCRQTPFQDQDHITLLRCYIPKETRERPKKVRECLSQPMIRYLWEESSTTNHYGDPILHLPNLFVVAKDGSSLNGVQYDLHQRKGGVIDSLSLLRKIHEKSVEDWITFCVDPDNEGWFKPDDIGWERFAKENTCDDMADWIDFADDQAPLQLPIMSSIDAETSITMRFAGSAATHNDRPSISYVNAVVYHTWLTQFIERTLGVHQLEKRGKSGSSIGDEYEGFVHTPVHDAHRCIFDQLRLLERNVAFCDEAIPIGTTEVSKSDVIRATYSVIQKMSDHQGIEWTRADGEFEKYLNYMHKRADNVDAFGSHDAIVAGMFAYHSFYFSTQPDHRHRKTPNPRIRFDENRRKLRSKGDRLARYGDLGLREKVEPHLKEELGLLKDMCKYHFPHHYDDKKIRPGQFMYVDLG